MRKVTITAAVVLAHRPTSAGQEDRRHNNPQGLPARWHARQRTQAPGLRPLLPGMGKQYTCRTYPKHSMNATDFVVGTDMKYQVDGDKAKLKTLQGKEVECKIVRVEAARP